MAIKIFIDQGHNPENPNAGAEANGLREQDVVYDVGTRLANMLAANPNFEVKTSRTTPEEILGTTNAESLAARVNQANKWGADYFLSIHANANTNPNISGSEAYVYNLYSNGYDLAKSILVGLNNAVGIPNRGVMLNKGLYVLRKTQMPAALIELGYLTNTVDANLLSSDPEAFARGVYNGILSYFGLNKE